MKHGQVSSTTSLIKRETAVRRS